MFCSAFIFCSAFKFAVHSCFAVDSFGKQKFTGQQASTAKQWVSGTESGENACKGKQTPAGPDSRRTLQWICSGLLTHFLWSRGFQFRSEWVFCRRFAFPAELAFPEGCTNDPLGATHRALHTQCNLHTMIALCVQSTVGCTWIPHNTLQSTHTVTQWIRSTHSDAVDTWTHCITITVHSWHTQWHSGHSNTVHQRTQWHSAFVPHTVQFTHTVTQCMCVSWRNPPDFYTWHDPLLSVLWLIPMCDMTHYEMRCDSHT